ncbi:P2Y purinoceptor 14-like [Triplophysa dalaica]|uniref:P2Y purinoceptor 14-like n=1 Tax=Triplophysa dalaica TaxID=1582913 RepID=UPI0024DF3A1E|nr:P2Y purinoceptor 14-like [Triplophysa dalaica]
METPVPATSITTSLNNTMKHNQTNITEALCEISKVPAHPVFIFAYSLVFLISLVLNCITMRVYFCTNQRVKSSVTVYLKNLAAADFFLCLCLPLRIAHNVKISVTLQYIYCSFGATAFYLNMYASITFMDFIAANRYLKIVRPLETNALQTVRFARLITIATWLFLASTGSIYLFLFLQMSWGPNQSYEDISCESLHSLQLILAYKIIHCVSIALFIFVLVSLIFLYWRTLQKLREAKISTPAVSSSQTFNKSKRNMLILVVIFCVCFVPYHLVRVFDVFFSDCTKAQVFSILKELTVLLSVLNACVDPLIYFIFCKAFRYKLGLRKKKHMRSVVN